MSAFIRAGQGEWAGAPARRSSAGAQRRRRSEAAGIRQQAQAYRAAGGAEALAKAAETFEQLRRLAPLAPEAYTQAWRAHMDLYAFVKPTDDPRARAALERARRVARAAVALWPHSDEAHRRLAETPGSIP